MLHWGLGMLLPATENQRARKHTFFKGGKTVQRRIAFKRYHTLDVEYEHWLVIYCIFLCIFPTMGFLYEQFLTYYIVYTEAWQNRKGSL